MMKLFDPWGDAWCTCPKKYSLNPYTGCEHKCIYCYITSYIPRSHECRIKRNLLKEVEREIKKVDPRIHISIANSSDPYTPMEKEFKLTRACLKLLENFKILIITKSDLVKRDIDLLKNMRVSVSITITTLNGEMAGKLEPFAPPPEKRIKALQELVGNGIKVSCRIDPIIPFLNEDTEKLVKELSSAGVSHVVSSTFKPRHDSWKRFENAFPEEAAQLKELYFEKGFRRHNAFYLPKEVRFKLMKNMRELCDKHGLTFAACREGFKINTATCDGSHLIKP